jgi:hypothetical protein
MEEGQVTPWSSFGKAIFETCIKNDVLTCVDVGAWNGRGTTQCIMKALNEKKKGHLYSFEIDDVMFSKASLFWEGNSQITLSKSRVCEKMMSIDEVINHPNYSNISSSNWMEWYMGEKRIFEKSEVGSLPELIDFVVIDGGEFSGNGDWEAVKMKNPRYVALDDVYTVKTSFIRDSLLSSEDWKVIAEGSDRNGWIILEHKN